MKKPIEFQDVCDWFDTFDADSECEILTDILNNEIKTEMLVDSVLLNKVGNIDLANDTRKNMYRRKK